MIDQDIDAAVVAGAARRRPAAAKGDGAVRPTAADAGRGGGGLLHRLRRHHVRAGRGRARRAGESFERSVRRAGVTLTYPAELPALCCGTPWKSKGMTDGYAGDDAQVLPALWAATRQGELPIVCDASSCTEGLRQMLESEMAAPAPDIAALRIVDAVAFAAEHVLPRLLDIEALASRWRCTPPARPPGWASNDTAAAGSPGGRRHR